jgi:hypothetical protein
MGMSSQWGLLLPPPLLFAAQPKRGALKCSRAPPNPLVAALASTSSDKERSIVDAIFSGSVGGGASRTVQDAEGKADEDVEDEDAVLQNAILEGKKRAAVSTSAAPAQKKNQTNQRKKVAQVIPVKEYLSGITCTIPAARRTLQNSSSQASLGMSRRHLLNNIYIFSYTVGPDVETQ